MSGSSSAGTTILQLVEGLDDDGGGHTSDRPDRCHPGRAALCLGEGQAPDLLGRAALRSDLRVDPDGGGRVYVRYLPAGAKIGNRRADYTIVGTYPTPNALNVLKDLAKQPTEKSVPAPGGGIAVYAKNAPTNVYVAFPGSDEQIEVFDPSAKRALRLVTSGRVAPVG